MIWQSDKVCPVLEWDLVFGLNISLDFEQCLEPMIPNPMRHEGDSYTGPSPMGMSGEENNQGVMPSGISFGDTVSLSRV
jgi:hypothetical protein